MSANESDRRHRPSGHYNAPRQGAALPSAACQITHNVVPTSCLLWTLLLPTPFGSLLQQAPSFPPNRVRPMPPTCQSTPLRRAVLGKRGCPWWKKNEQETHTPENRRQWLRSGLKVDPRTAQGLQNLSKWSQNGSQRRSKINELSDFTKNVKRHKNTVKTSIFKSSSISKITIFRSEAP